MRYPIGIARPWQPLFALFGFAPSQSYLELDAQALHAHYGTAHEHIPLREIAGVRPYHWPFYYGLGAKLGPQGGVSYVGSPQGVVQIDFVRPRPLNVWGPFRAARARCLIVSLEQAEQFMRDLQAALVAGHPESAASS